MLLQIGMIVAGVVLVLWGADRLTDGAVALAERMKISQIVIGLTIVAVGTSAPEFCVSLVSALKGTADLAVGNVVGSNIFNAMLITGVAAMVAPMTILPSTVRKDIPIAVVASLALTIMVLTDGDLSRLDAAMLLAGFIGFMWLTLHGAKDKGSDDTAPSKTLSVGRALLMLVVGLACLVAGSNIFVDGATEVAARLGVSEAVIGLTVVAGGTSLPELATSVMAARKGSSDIALGNVVGSNVFNILWILGFCSVIAPLPAAGLTVVDYAVMALGLLLVWLFALRGRINRLHGAILIAVFGGYMCWLLMNV